MLREIHISEVHYNLKGSTKFVCSPAYWYLCMLASDSCGCCYRNCTDVAWIGDWACSLGGYQFEFFEPAEPMRVKDAVLAIKDGECC